ncbi:MAG: signal peptidase I [Candidatus Pacebacteria bacterium]|nr:signal peptidase I [Candidatus Paceibacterota bacterium]
MENENKENIEKTPEKQPESTAGFRRSLWEFVKFFIIAGIIVVPLRLWIAQPFIVSGSSMYPNFENGEYLIIDEFSYKFKAPQRGEVIVFRYPDDPSKFFIKRIVGLPGERVEIKNNSIYAYNNEFPEGIMLQESYLPEEMRTTNLTMLLSNDQYFVMGDNRGMSSDSRSWGPLKKDLIIGRAWIRLWPFNKASISF